MQDHSSTMRYSTVMSRLTLAIFVLVSAACSQADTVNINVSGSSTVLPVVSRAAEQYAQEMPEVRVVVNAGGSGVGVKQLGSGQTDIGMISRDITDGEYEQYADVGLKTYAIGVDAVVPVVSSEIYAAGVTSLTFPQIASIYRGEVTNWSAIGGPDLEILVIDKEASRGTRQVFMSKIMGNKNATAPGAKLVLGSNNEEQTALAQSDAAIGMLSHAWLNDDVKGLSIIIADGAPIEPTLANIKNGQFPITRNLLLVSRSDLSAPAQDFIDYILSPEGQKIVEESGYIRVSE